MSKIYLTFIAFLVIVVIFNILLILRDEAIAISADQYEACIRQQYHISPALCRERNNGAMCDCLL